MTEEARSTADWWWRDETATTWKKEPLRSGTMAFRNEEKKMVVAPCEEDEQWHDLF